MTPTISPNTLYSDVTRSSIVAYSAGFSALPIEDERGNADAISLVLETNNFHMSKRAHIPPQNNKDDSRCISLVVSDKEDEILPVERNLIKSRTSRKTNALFVIKNQKIFSKRTGLQNGKFIIDDAFDKLFDELDAKINQDFS